MHETNKWCQVIPLLCVEDYTLCIPSPVVISCLEFLREMSQLWQTLDIYHDGCECALNTNEYIKFWRDLKTKKRQINGIRFSTFLVRLRWLFLLCQKSFKNMFSFICIYSIVLIYLSFSFALSQTKEYDPPKWRNLCLLETKSDTPWVLRHLGHHRKQSSPSWKKSTPN